MSNITLILGQSGVGKSSAIRTLEPSETFIINVLGKPLPFKGANKSYRQKELTDGNLFSRDKSETIIKAIRFINAKRPDIKNLVIDDFTYIMINEFMEKAREKGFDKFSIMAQNAWAILDELAKCRTDLLCFVINHSEEGDDKIVRFKTIGKLTDKMSGFEARATIVLHAFVIDGEYKFLTQNDGVHLAKSPLGMFPDLYIPNDLHMIRGVIDEYFNDELTPQDIFTDKARTLYKDVKEGRVNIEDGAVKLDSLKIDFPDIAIDDKMQNAFNVLFSGQNAQNSGVN